MANSDNTKLRILRLWSLLRSYTDENHMISRNELIRTLEAENLGAVRQTISNDITALELAGLNISTEMKGKNICYRLNTRVCTFSELKILMDFVATSPFITEEQSKALSGKIMKYASVYENPSLVKKYCVPEQVKTLNPETLNNLHVIHKAIQDNRQIRFSLIDFNWQGHFVKTAGSEEIVSPGYVIKAYNTYYLLALSNSRNKIVEYRIDKITDITVINDRRKEIDSEMKGRLIRYEKYMFGMSEGNIRSVTLECLKSKASLIYDRFGTYAIPFPSETPGWFHVTVDVVESEQFYGWVSGMKNNIRIMQPEDVRERFKAYLRKITDSYN